MSQFYKIAGKTTNCTDNCKVCLEEEGVENIREIEVGDKVRYVTENTEEDKEQGFYPPKGTVGVVIGIEEDDIPYRIKWPKGTTKGDGCWYVGKKDIELVDD